MHLQPFPDLKKYVFHALLHTQLHKKVCALNSIILVNVWLPLVSTLYFKFTID